MMLPVSVLPEPVQLKVGIIMCDASGDMTDMTRLLRVGLTRGRYHLIQNHPNHPDATCCIERPRN